MVTAELTLVLKDGHMLEVALGRQRLTQTEVRQAIRASGVGDVAQVAAVVLESDETMSAIPVTQVRDGSALGSETGRVRILDVSAATIHRRGTFSLRARRAARGRPSRSG